MRRPSVVTVVKLAAACAWGALAGCTRAAPDATPEGAVHLWLEKMEASSDDPHASREAYELLGPAAHANLEERAERASKMQGRRVEPFEMLAEGRFGLNFRPKSMSARIDPDGEHATVEVLGDAPSSEHALVRCARVAAPGARTAGDKPSAPASANAWRVEPELPALMLLPKRAPDSPSPDPR